MVGFGVSQGGLWDWEGGGALGTAPCLEQATGLPHTHTPQQNYYTCSFLPTPGAKEGGVGHRAPRRPAPTQGTLRTLCDLLQSFAWDLDTALSVMGSVPPDGFGVPSEARKGTWTLGLAARVARARVSQAAGVLRLQDL